MQNKTYTLLPWLHFHRISLTPHTPPPPSIAYFVFICYDYMYMAMTSQNEHVENVDIRVNLDVYNDLKYLRKHV